MILVRKGFVRVGVLDKPGKIRLGAALRAGARRASVRALVPVQPPPLLPACSTALRVSICPASQPQARLTLA